MGNNMKFPCYTMWPYSLKEVPFFSVWVGEHEYPHLRHGTYTCREQFPDEVGVCRFYGEEEEDIPVGDIPKKLIPWLIRGLEKFIESEAENPVQAVLALRAIEELKEAQHEALDAPPN